MEDDLDAFSAKSFDTTAWVNNALSRIPGNDPLEAYLASLTMKLHIISQDYTDQLENAMVDAVATMPRVLSEVARVEDVLSSVNKEMSELAGQLRTFDQRNVQGVGDLSRLDLLKTNMERSKALLQDHASWGQLVREAKAFLEGGGRLADTADRIAAMRRSLTQLASMPGHEDRCAICTKLSDSLLAAVKPHVLREIGSASDDLNVTTMQEYLYVYSQLDRRAELEAEYVRARPTHLIDSWLAYSPMSTSFSSFLDFFDYFIKSLEALLRREAVHVKKIFATGDSEGGTSSSGTGTGAARPSKNPLPLSLSLSLSSAGSASFPTADALLSRLWNNILEATFQSNLHERIRETMSPEDARHAYVAVSAFALRCIPVVHSVVADAEAGKCVPAMWWAALAKSLSTLFSSLANNMDVVCYSEGVSLRTALADEVVAVQFGVDADGHTVSPGMIGGGSASNDVFEDATGLGLSAADMEGRGLGSGGEEVDPVYGCTLYSWRLLSAVKAIERICVASLERSCGYFGGLHVQHSIKTTSAALAVFIQQLVDKIDVLGVGCGLPSRASVGDAASGGVFQSKSKGSDNKKATLVIAEAWARRLQAHGTTSISRQLIPPALRALQVTGIVSEVSRRIEASARKCMESAQRNLLSPNSSSGSNIITSTGTEALPAATAAFAAEAIGAAQSGTEGGSSTSALGAAYGRYRVRQSDFPSLEQYLNSAAGSPTTALLEHVPAALQGLQSRAGGLFFDICTSEPQRTLHNLSAYDDVWANEAEADSTRPPLTSAKEATYLCIDESLLPQAAITHCGEHLLSLVQELEQFAASDALSDLDAMRGQAATHAAHSAGWGSEMHAALGGVSKGVSPESVEQLCRRASAAAVVKAAEQDMFQGSVASDLTDGVDIPISPSFVCAAGETPLADNSLSNADVATRFVSEWLQAVCDAVTGLVLAQLVRITRLTHHGRAQLAVDIDYLKNVIAAMGLGLHPVLSHVRTLLSRNPADLLSEVNKQAVRGAAGSALLRVDTCVARACLAGSTGAPSPSPSPVSQGVGRAGGASR